jgi:hypothetical protein
LIGAASIIVPHLQSPNDVTINGRNPNLEFIVNVNESQRDQYGLPHAYIQGVKNQLNEKESHSQVLVKLKVDTYYRFDDEIDTKCTLFRLNLILLVKTIDLDWR